MIGNAMPLQSSNELTRRNRFRACSVSFDGVTSAWQATQPKGEEDAQMVNVVSYSGTKGKVRICQESG
jgi:hypothetical protein